MSRAIAVTMLVALAGSGLAATEDVAHAAAPLPTVSMSAPSLSAPGSVVADPQTVEPTADATPLLPASQVVRIPPVALSPGDEGSMVAALQTLLSDAGFYRSEIDGEFGSHTAHAVVAFHKAIDAERTSTWAEGDWELLAAFRPSVPHRPDEPDRLEMDLTRQLLYRFAEGEVVDIIPISSGNGEAYYNAAGNLVRARTPRGDYSLYRHVSGWRISYLGGLYQPWYFRGGYAVHGSNSVPPYPASHGCVRIPNWEADHLAGQLWLGLPIHVWDAPPVADPPALDIAWESSAEPEVAQPSAA